MAAEKNCDVYFIPFMCSLFYALLIFLVIVVYAVLNFDDIRLVFVKKKRAAKADRQATVATTIDEPQSKMSKTTKSKVTTTASDLQTVKNTATGDDAPKTTAAESNPNPTTDCADLNTVKSTVQTETKESKQQDVESKI